MHDRDANEVPVPHDAARRIEVDPARTRNVDLSPGVGIAAGDSLIIAIIRQMEISRYKASGDAAGAQYGDHEYCEVTTTPTPEPKGLYRILDSLLVPRCVRKSPPDSPRHVDEQIVGVGRAVGAEEGRAPAVEFGMGGRQLGEAFESGPICRWVGEGIGASKIRDIGGAKAARCVVETDVADKAKLGSPISEICSRHVIAESIHRPGQLPRLGSDFDLGVD